jgi:hypothetical protein
LIYISPEVAQPAFIPTKTPTLKRTQRPTWKPTKQLTYNPTKQPTEQRTQKPTWKPTTQLTHNPTTKELTQLTPNFTPQTTGLLIKNTIQPKIDIDTSSSAQNRITIENQINPVVSILRNSNQTLDIYNDISPYIKILN